MAPNDPLDFSALGEDESVARLLALTKSSMPTAAEVEAVCELARLTPSAHVLTVAIDCLAAIAARVGGVAAHAAAQTIVAALSRGRPRHRHIQVSRALGQLGVWAVPVLPVLWRFRRGPFRPKYRIREAMDAVASAAIRSPDPALQALGVRCLIRNNPLSPGWTLASIGALQNLPAGAAAELKRCSLALRGLAASSTEEQKATWKAWVASSSFTL
jgi:hypothetical protein